MTMVDMQARWDAERAKLVATLRALVSHCPQVGPSGVPWAERLAYAQALGVAERLLVSIDSTPT